MKLWSVLSASEVPGEHTSSTQPFPVKPLPLARNSFNKNELYNLTPEHAAFCKKPGTNSDVQRRTLHSLRE